MLTTLAIFSHFKFSGPFLVSLIEQESAAQTAVLTLHRLLSRDVRVDVYGCVSVKGGKHVIVCMLVNMRD